MAGEQSRGPMCVADKPWWQTAIDEGTMSRMKTPTPGHTTSDFDLIETICMRPKVEQVTPPPESLFSELLIIEANEWAKFIVGVAGNAFAPIKEDVLGDLKPALTKLGVNGRAAIKVVNGKKYVVISGYAGLRKILTGTKYLPNNPKVADLVIGTKALGKSALRSTAVGFAAVAVADVVVEVILGDMELLSKELGFTIFTDLGKVAVGSIAGYIVAATVATLGAPVVWPIAAGILVGVAVGFVLDKYYPTEKIVKAMDEYYNSLLRRASRAFQDLERQILWQIWPHGQMPFPY